MSIPLRWLMLAGTLVFVLALPQGSDAQVELAYTLKYTSGQNVQPIFEGWSRNPDGSFSMHFGYLNRNFVEELHIPIGPENNIEPGGPDRGQPTFFHTRINRNLFTVVVPKDWDKKELVWTVMVRGKTEKAVAWLQPEWEIDPVGGASGGGRDSDEQSENKPPAIAVDPIQPITLPNTLTLTATAADDGLPKPRTRKPAVGQETPPILKAPTDAPVNVPDIPSVRGGGADTRPQGLLVSWIVWRGPAGVTFDPRSVPLKDVKDGRAVVTATFTRPGEYVLRARANDGMLSARQDITVTVKGPPSSNRP